MNLLKLDGAIKEAERFLVRAKSLKSMMEEYKRIESEFDCDYPFNSPKEQGAVNRASMDLTRALADLRRRGE